MNPDTTVHRPQTIPFPERNAEHNRPAVPVKERITPQSWEAEQSTIGAMLMERAAISQALTIAYHCARR